MVQLLNKISYKFSKLRMFYTVVFVLFCLIDQRIKTGTGLDGWIETFRAMTGVGIALLILSNYKWNEFVSHKVPYLTWTIISVSGGLGALVWGKQNRYFFNEWVVIIADVILFGYILIHTFLQVVREKRYPRLNKKFLLVWVIMMVLMVISRSDYIWPFCYLVMFACFYLTDFTHEEQKDMFQGMLDGIILAFFLMQGWCFLFRPYDVVRYVGVYNNPNLNALFYLEVLVAIFAKIIYVNRIGAGRLIRIYYWLGAGILISFLFLTIGRIAWITAFVLTLIFLGYLKVIQRCKRFFLNGLILVVVVCITFPLCFAAVRYLPPVFHHPVWFWGEWSEEKVHSWDTWDSEKFVDLDEFSHAAIGRVLESVENLLEHSPFAIRAQAAETDNAEKDAVLTMQEGYDSFLVRKTIYQYYASNLNWWGYPYEEQGFQLTPRTWVGHAHNIYLQYGTDFGIVVMILFIVTLVWAVAVLFCRMRAECKESDVASMFFVLIPMIFGLFEYCWGPGSITILLLFVAWRKAICDEERQ